MGEGLVRDWIRKWRELRFQCWLRRNYLLELSEGGGGRLPLEERR